MNPFDYVMAKSEPNTDGTSTAERSCRDISQILQIQQSSGIATAADGDTNHQRSDPP